MHPLKSVACQVLRHYPHEASLPSYQHEDDSGFDLVAATSTRVYIPPGTHLMLPTGLRFEVPPGFELQVRSRSGLASKHGAYVLNEPGTVDASYRGEVKVLLAVEADAKRMHVDPGDRIAQAVLAPVYQAELYFHDELGRTTRGDGGFGSTG